ncbi:MAG: hypothetical protein SGJ19_18710 [Planctomycetia bacterium]|nr:hypothetical protein [Planctomycetia bacterium]
MNFRGVIRNGEIVIDGGLPFPDGTKLTFELHILSVPGDASTSNHPVAADDVLKPIDSTSPRPEP